jgi:hypothetical protein
MAVILLFFAGLGGMLTATETAAIALMGGVR